MHRLHTSHNAGGSGVCTSARTHSLKYAAVAALRGVSQLECKRPLRRKEDTGVWIWEDVCERGTGMRVNVANMEID